MVYTIFLGKPWKSVYNLGPERKVYTIEASDPEKEKKGGFPRWWCILFLPFISGDFIFTNFGSLTYSQYQLVPTNLRGKGVSSLTSEDFGLLPH